MLVVVGAAGEELESAARAKSSLEQSLAFWEQTLRRKKGLFVEGTGNEAAPAVAWHGPFRTESCIASPGQEPSFSH